MCTTIISNLYLDSYIINIARIVIIELQFAFKLLIRFIPTVISFSKVFAYLLALDSLHIDIVHFPEHVYC